MGRPDPEGAADLDDLVARLRLLKAWAGDPSYTVITKRITEGWSRAGRPASELPGRSTVAGYFSAGRSRLDEDLLAAIAEALGGDAGYAEHWRAAVRAIRSRATAASWVDSAARLPTGTGTFVGRRDELDRLLTADGATVVVSAIRGMPGVGKTTLALHAAHQLLARGRFQDVQLFVDLRGFDTDSPPADPAAVLADFLRHLGVPGDRVPPTLAGRIAKYRELLHGRHALIVLDNAYDERGVAPLLPGHPTCLTLVTSRRTLAGLPDAVHLRLDPFAADEARQLLRQVAGAERVDADPQTAARIAELVGHLPLALAIVGGHLRDHPDWLLTDYLRPLTTLAMEGGIGAALTMSDRNLPVETRRTLRLLALHPGQEWDGYAAAALTGEPMAVARARLDELAAAHLVQRRGPDRYGFHDLVRAYAAERAAVDEPASRSRAALTRLFDHYLHAAAMAMNTLYPADKGLRPDPPPPAGPEVPGLGTADGARAWLEAEHANLIAGAGHAADNGWPAHAVHLAATVWRHLDITSRTEAMLALAEQALPGARATGDRVWEARIMLFVGNSHNRRGDFEAAARQLRQAVAIAREAGDRLGEARGRDLLGWALAQLGRHDEALIQMRHAVRIARRIGDQNAVGSALNNMGILFQRQGRYDELLALLDEALVAARAADSRATQARILGNMGVAHVERGDQGAALRHLREALAIHRDLGNRTGEAIALINISRAHHQRGDDGRAYGEACDALAILRETGDRAATASALNAVGEAVLRLGRPAEAEACHREALEVAIEIGSLFSQARAHTGLGDVHQATADPAAAAHHWRQALAAYTDLDVPEAQQVRDRLSAQ
ncbi:tetratricopeptide repeat protein [Dactylosporangium fulvum]|uniref:Tetratricopeptide repeat protein n=1 Tax=Dactylosporangium fulvum TaxID=53359 RepID=A0ABY5WD15_9ACTN|nr:tetratricopeptide repeat protein [Dactylosporangium fulvum]UWP87014.1 tetratricopeptide repeat protein [Dactylosporangium fulvum]